MLGLAASAGCKKGAADPEPTGPSPAMACEAMCAKTSPKRAKCPAQCVKAIERGDLNVAAAQCVTERGKKAMRECIVERLPGARERLTLSAKTTEAVDNLDRIFKSAVSYFSIPKVARDTGSRLPCQFPASAGPTPTKTCCANGKNQCAPDAAAWGVPTWSALSFELTAPHHYVYEVTSKGVGPAATLTISAYGDLDCDGIMSTFRRTVTGKVDGRECTYASPAAFEEHNPLE